MTIPHKKKVQLTYTLRNNDFYINDKIIAKKEHMYKPNKFGRSDILVEGASIIIYEEDTKDNNKLNEYKKLLINTTIKAQQKVIQPVNKI